MTSLGDSWSAGTGKPTAELPPRPDVARQPGSQSPTPEIFSTAPTWKRAGAILGVVGGFCFLLTIPGWIALAHYKRWKRDEIRTPNGLIAWGYFFTAAILFAIVAVSIDPSA
jgi:hypothetical protein